MADPFLTLSKSENQARGLARYAIDFVAGQFGEPAAEVIARTEMFHTDSIACGVSALARGARAPTILRREAFRYRTSDGATCFGSSIQVQPEKAVLAGSCAVREWDANGTNFGYNPDRGATRGEFGHNDFYPVAVAAAQRAGLDGRGLVRAMVCLDEIRGRLAEAFALNDHAIDHVLHGAIASAAVYAATLGGGVDQIESAIGLVVAHHVPFRAIRSGHQLSDSKGASAAISAEAAVQAARRALEGFVGPADIFRNRQAVFCLFEPPGDASSSPFDLTLATSGDDFAVMGMHFKLGLYEHQSAGAIQALIDLVAREPGVFWPDEIDAIEVTIYEPAYGIICDPAKRDPRTRQSADHSLYYIVARTLAKAYASSALTPALSLEEREIALWKTLMLTPDDYSDAALADPLTRGIMKKITVRHGGPEYDAKYPDGIPTSLAIEHASFGRLESPLVMYPMGHARNGSGQIQELLTHKFRVLAADGVDDPNELAERMSNLQNKTASEVRDLYHFTIRGAEPSG